MSSCADCKFFIANPAPASERVAGDCRVHAPVPMYDQSVAGNVGTWPRVPVDAWCGEHQPAEAAP
jgi:hypothetical protein